jgi:hypothetical protein
MANATTTLRIVEETTSTTLRIEKDEVIIEARPPTPAKAVTTEKEELNLLVNSVLAEGNEIATGPEILMGPPGSSIALKHEILRLRALTTTTSKPVCAGEMTTNVASTIAEDNKKQLVVTAQTSTTTSVEERALTGPESTESHAVQVVEASKSVPASLETIVEREGIIFADSKSDIAGTAARCNEERVVARVPHAPDSIATADLVGEMIETDPLSPVTSTAIPFAAVAFPDTEDPSPASSVAFGMTDSTAFSVTVSTVTGVCETFERLHADTEVFKLCELVAKRFGIPDFAVRLMIGGQVIHMSCIGMTLDMAGIAEGSDLLLVKQFGWGKPDLRTLDDMEKRWRR